MTKRKTKAKAKTRAKTRSKAKAKAKPRAKAKAKSKAKSKAGVRKTTQKSGLGKFSHLSDSGQMQMVEVSDKPVTKRRAVARAVVEMDKTTRDAITQNKIAKGDVLAAVRLAAIQGAKRTSDLVPLCHPLPLSVVELDIAFPHGKTPKGRVTVRLRASCAAHAQTGVEMEAMTAVSVAALTLYDFCKSLDKSVRVVEIALEEKSGGKSGNWRRKEVSASK